MKVPKEKDSKKNVTKEEPKSKMKSISKATTKSSEPRISKRISVKKTNQKPKTVEEVIDSSSDTLSSGLSEFMTTYEESVKQDDEEKINIAETLPNIFPLKISKDDIKLNPDPIKDVKGLNSREVTFTGKYKGVDISCLCVIAFGDVKYHQDQYYYGFGMSEQLIACRNMASYLDMFDANILEMISFINNAPKEPALFIVKPLFLDGTLGQYLKFKRQSETYLEPLHMIQMGISLFSMLSDAHDQNIGLVDITLDNIFVGGDGGLYFDGFQYSVFLDDPCPTHKKSWMDMKMIKCPESKDLKNAAYKKSTDVFLASTILLELVKNFKYHLKRLYIQNSELKTITVIKEAVDERHANLIDIIKQGLKYNPEDRPPASDILYWLETIRYKSIAADLQHQLL